MNWDFSIIGLLVAVIGLIGVLIYERQSRQQKRKRRNLAIFVFVVLPGVCLLIDWAEKSIERGHANHRSEQAGRTEADVRRSREILEALVADKHAATLPTTEFERPLRVATASPQMTEAQEPSNTATSIPQIVESQKTSSTETASLQTAETQSVREVEAKPKPEEANKDAAAERARLLARYLRSTSMTKVGLTCVAVAIESETGTMNPSIANALAQRFNTAEVRLFNSFFKPEFVADKFVGSIFSGDTRIFDRLELTNWLSGVLVGRQTITYSTNTALEDTVTANLRLEVMVLPIGFALENQSWNFAANGAAFSRSGARQAAEDRVVQQIANNTNMFLVTTH